MLKAANRFLAAGPKAGLLAVAMLTFAGSVPADGHPGAVYAMNNAVNNAIMVYDRAPDGTLTLSGTVATNGKGTGAGLGSQGALALSNDGRWLFAVNAGSNEISVFAVTAQGLAFRGKASSGGATPISVTVNGDAVFVVNAGGTPNISGFRMGHDGTLTPIPGSSRAVSGTTPAEILFSRDGELLVVTLKGPNMIDTFVVDGDNVTGPFPQPSQGQTPFGFTFDNRGHLIVTEAFGGAPGASAVSSYDVGDSGQLKVVTGSLRTQQTSACWIAVTRNGRYGYAADTPASVITGVSIGHDGAVALLDPTGVSAKLADGSNPADLAISADGRFLYSLNSGNGTIGAFRVASDGSLGFLGTVSGLPAGASGLAAR